MYFIRTDKPLTDAQVKRVRAAIAYHGMTHRDVADKAETHPTSITNVLARRRSPTQQMAVLFSDLVTDAFADAEALQKERDRATEESAAM